MSKHKPATRAEFKAQILRKLGAPVIKINVSADQVEDCIEEALKYYADYHYDGSEHVYYRHLITSTDITNRYITVPDTIIGIVQLFSLNSQAYSISSANYFNGGYQIALDLAFDMSTGSVLSYYMNKTAYEFLNQMIIGQTPLRYNRHINRVYIDTNWDTVAEGTYFILDAYSRVDPDTNTDMWSDRWLAKYAAAKIKYIWGSNMSKFDGMQLPGSVALNGTKIQDDAKDEIQGLEDDMLTSYSIVPRDFTG